ncbi:MAG: diguanylate cyclase domain-containing protein [Ilumatobacteraceae bacterium]
MDADTQRLEREAIAARGSGAFEVAAGLFGEAATACTDGRRCLDMRIRQAVCLVMIDRSEDAFSIAADVARDARADGHLAELADALGVMVDHLVRVGRIAEGAQVLSEALDVLAQVPTSDASYAVTHNLAASLEHSGFFPESVELFRRAMELATDPADIQFTAASMVSAYQYAAARSTDPAVRDRFVADGIALAESLDVVSGEVHAVVSAMAHEALLLVYSGRFAEALERATVARSQAAELGLPEEAAMAAGALAVARWRLDADPAVLAEIEDVLATAATLNRLEDLGAVQDVQVEILWGLGRLDDARHVLEDRIVAGHVSVAAERQVRWDHVQLGVEHRRMALLSESDPLTGLRNRRSLERTMPDLLASGAPLVVGVVDLDGFKQVNDQLGYARGDAVIREVADLLEGMCRRGDLVVRLGGDEFVLVLREIDAQGAARVFERVRKLLDSHSFQGVPESIPLSASIGVMAIEPGERRELHEILVAASTAMQASKKQGRNRVTFV